MFKYIADTFHLCLPRTIMDITSFFSLSKFQLCWRYVRLYFRLPTSALDRNHLTVPTSSYGSDQVLRLPYYVLVWPFGRLCTLSRLGKAHFHTIGQDRNYKPPVTLGVYQRIVFILNWAVRYVFSVFFADAIIRFNSFCLSASNGGTSWVC